MDARRGPRARAPEHSRQQQGFRRDTAPSSKGGRVGKQCVFVCFLMITCSGLYTRKQTVGVPLPPPPLPLLAEDL